MKNPIMVMLGVSILSACDTTGEFVNSYEAQPGLIMHSYSDDLQTAVVKQAGSSSKVCLEPSPDVGAGGGVQANLGDAGGDRADLSETRTVVSLGGRSDLTLVTRELMYRACELSVNNNLSPQETVAVYTTFLNALGGVAKTIGPPGL